MTTFFLLGCIFTILLTYATYKLVMFGYEHGMRTIKDYLMVIVLSIVLMVPGPTMMYYGYYVPSYNLSTCIDNGNGTMTVTERSMSGEIRVKENVKSPKTTYGTVTSVSKNSRMMGKVIHTYYLINVKLNDGRTMTHKVNYMVTSGGKGMSITESFYPVYDCTFNF